MVNKVRRTIWNKRNIERQFEQEHLELVATEDKFEEIGPGDLLAPSVVAFASVAGHC